MQNEPDCAHNHISRCICYMVMSPKRSCILQIVLSNFWIFTLSLYVLD